MKVRSLFMLGNIHSEGLKDQFKAKKYYQEAESIADNDKQLKSIQKKLKDMSI